MNGQPMKRISIVIAIAVLAVGTLAGVSYALIGAPASTSATVTSTATDSDRSGWPGDVDEEFALKTWQEQLESRAVLDALATGRVEQLHVDDIRTSDDSGTIAVTVTFTDGTTSEGEIDLGQRGGKWYVSSLCGLRTTGSGDAETMKPVEDPESKDLPSPDEVDMDMLKTMMWQQADNQDYIQEMLSGEYETIQVLDTQQGPGTTTVKTSATGAEGTEEGELVLVRSSNTDVDTWFVASLKK